jgi:hypothetical protein
MADDVERLSLSGELIDVVIAEVKKNQPCGLNGPWTSEERQNVHRVLAAIGCVPHNTIDAAARRIYRDGIWLHKALRIRLIAVGAERNPELVKRFPQVVQLTWPENLQFIWNRFRAYRHQKTQVDQWDEQGLLLKRIADTTTVEDFISTALAQML